MLNFWPEDYMNTVNEVYTSHNITVRIQTCSNLERGVSNKVILFKTTVASICPLGILSCLDPGQAFKASFLIKLFSVTLYNGL